VIFLLTYLFTFDVNQTLSFSYSASHADLSSPLTRSYRRNVVVKAHL